MLYTNAIRPQQTEPTWLIRIRLLISLASEAQLSSVRIGILYQPGLPTDACTKL
jgi:hypothetical protein